MRQLWHDLNAVHVTLSLGHVLVMFFIWRILGVMWLLHREDRRERRQQLSQQNWRVRRAARKREKRPAFSIPGMVRR